MADCLWQDMAIAYICHVTVTVCQSEGCIRVCVLVGGVYCCLHERDATFFLLTMLRQHSQYDSRLGFSFRVLVRVRLGLGLG